MKISDGYRQEGVGAFYENHAHEYTNPHAAMVRTCLAQIGNIGNRILDVGCGDGLVTKSMKKSGREFVGIDQYMADRYRKETGFPCHTISFEKVSTDGLPAIGLFDVAICSYMVDIIPESYRATFFWQISLKAERIITIRPNKHSIACSFLEKINHIKCEKSNLMVFNSLIFKRE